MLGPMAYGQTISIPFHTANNLILLDMSIDGKPATLVLDTGATYTYLVPRFSPGWKAEAARANTRGTYYATDVKLEVAGRQWSQWHVLVDDVSTKVSLRIDGILGEDWLKTFTSVRINYKQHVIECLH